MTGARIKKTKNQKIQEVYEKVRVEAPQTLIQIHIKQYNARIDLLKLTKLTYLLDRVHYWCIFLVLRPSDYPRLSAC